MTQPHAPGWYDDPFSSDLRAERFWDGSDWTPRRRPKRAITSPNQQIPTTGPGPNTQEPQGVTGGPGPTSGWGPHPVGSPGTPASAPYTHPIGGPSTSSPAGQKKPWFLVALAAGVVLLGLVVLMIRAGGHGNRSDGQASQSSNQSGPQTEMPSIPPSTQDDWEAAVCKPGTFHNGGGHLPNADGSGFCLSLSGAPVMIGQYSSSFSLKNDIALFRGSSYATIDTDGGGAVLFLSISPRSVSALEPLRQYGFQVGTNP